MELKRRFFQVPGNSFFLFGPRGTGKTTFLSQAFPDSLRVDLLEPETFRLFSSRPERFRELVRGNPDKTTIILDEIQKIPALLDVVHLLIEEKKSRMFVLTGSSARKLKRSGVDLLAGRALSKSLHPFMAGEMGGDFSVDAALRFGCIPLVLDSADPLETLKSYIMVYLKEEVQAEGAVRNLGDFSRFLEVITFSHGSLLNISEIARECEVGRKTAEGYISILEDLLLSFTIRVFSRRAKRILTNHPKLYLFDSGVFRTLKPKGPMDDIRELEGAALEGLVAQHLRAWISYRGKENNLYFWRTKSGVEVDFVVYGEDGFYALEVKKTNIVRRNDLKPLKAFMEDYPEASPVFLYRGGNTLLIDGIRCIPVENFLKSLHPSSPLPP